MNIAQAKIHQAALEGAYASYKKLITQSISNENEDELSKEQSIRIRASYLEYIEALELLEIKNATQLFMLVGCAWADSKVKCNTLDFSE